MHSTSPSWIPETYALASLQDQTSCLHVNEDKTTPIQCSVHNKGYLRVTFVEVARLMRHEGQ